MIRENDRLKGNHCAKIASSGAGYSTAKKEQQFINIVQDDSEAMSFRNHAAQQLIDQFNYGKAKIERMLRDH